MEIKRFGYRDDVVGGTETPTERLRNLLTPFLTLVEILDQEKDNLTISHKNVKFNSLLDQIIKACQDNKDGVKFYLSDIENFYSKK